MKKTPTVCLCRRAAPDDLSGRSAEMLLSILNFKQRHADYRQTVTDHYFSGGLWMAGFRALPETA
jgi:hypothetical protein